MEFTNQFVFVKDKDKKRVLLSGLRKDGLYQVKLPKNFVVSPRIFISRLNKASDSLSCFNSKFPLHKLWHYHLGDPSCTILNKVASQSNFSISS